MKLFLTSSGFGAKVEQEFLALLGRDPKGLRLAFVPTAAKGDYPIVPFPALHLALKGNEDYRDLIRLGFQIDFIDLENLSEETVSDAFAPYDVIYMYGGNTFYLMYHADRSGFKKHAGEILLSKIYVGVSAGSIIAGPDIALAGWEGGDTNRIGIQDTAGLSLASFCVLPHWDSIIPREASAYPYEVKYVKDGEAIAI